MIKIKKKKSTALLLAITMMLSLCGLSGCKNKEKEPSNTSELVAVDPSATETDSLFDASDSDADKEDPFATLNGLSVYAQADPDSAEAIAEQEKFEQYLSDSFKESVVNDTVTLHYTLAHPENYDLEIPEPTFGDTGISDEDIAADKQEDEDDLAELQEFDYDLLTANQKFTYDILENEIETNLEFYNYIDLYEPFAYTSGLHSNLPVTMSEYRFYTIKDVDDYIALLNLSPDYIQIYLDFEKQKSEKGLFMNSHSANEVIRQCNEFIANPEKNLLIETFNDRIGDVPEITDEEIETYKQANYDAVMNSVIPAYKNIINTFTSLKNTGVNELGLANFENGTDYYKYLIKSKVGSDKTPEEIIDLLEEKIEGVMSEFSSVALSNYSAYEAYIEADNLYGDLDPKETILFFEDAFSDKFPKIPDIDFTISPVHESLENIVSPAFFMTPPVDDYEHNTIHTNLDSKGAGGIWNTLAHEGIPGHMYQFVYFLSNDPELLRTILDFSGYQEGWATYIELMSYDYFDNYPDACYADFEKINSELNLLVSARVEIGVNYEGWDLEDTKNYLNSNGFNGDAAQDIMDYVIAEPGNYQMYVLGWLEFEEMRAAAEDELGDDFDEQAFHKVLLDAGPCQFYLLDKLVEDYIFENKSQIVY